MTQGSLISVVDDDESVRESLPALLSQFGYRVRAFSTAEAFLESDCVSETACLLLDVAMPGMSGLELQRALTRRQQAIPIIFITACPDDSLRALVLSEGAVDSLVKPFSDTVLLESIKAAIRGPA